MAKLDPRIHNALLTINPTSKRPAWHGAPTLLGTLRGVKAPAALWRPCPQANNIREIALHIAFWENSVAGRLSGQSNRLEFRQRKTGWAARTDSVDQAQWKEEMALVATVHERLVQVVTAFDPRRLDKPPGPNTERIAIEYIHGVGEHTLYHTAQIKMLKTQSRKAGF